MTAALAAGERVAAGAAKAGRAGASGAAKAGKAGAAATRGAGRAASNAAKSAGNGVKGGAGPERHTPRNLNGLSAEDAAEEMDARKADARWAKEERAAGRDPDRGREAEPEPTSSTSSSPSKPGADVVHTGGGAILGVLAWVLFRNYLEGGVPQVKKWGAAKFLNKTGA